MKRRPFIVREWTEPLEHRPFDIEKFMEKVMVVAGYTLVATFCFGVSLAILSFIVCAIWFPPR